MLFTVYVTAPEGDPEAVRQALADLASGLIDTVSAAQVTVEFVATPDDVR